MSTVVVNNEPYIMTLAGDGPAVVVTYVGSDGGYASGQGVTVNPDKTIDIGGGDALTETRTVAVGARGQLRVVGSLASATVSESNTIFQVTNESTGELMFLQISSDIDGPLMTSVNSPAYATEIVTLSIVAGNVAWDWLDGQAAFLTLTGNATLQNPTNKSRANYPSLEVKQDAVGGHVLSFGSDYIFPDGYTAPATTALSRTLYHFQRLQDGKIAVVATYYAQ